MLMPRKLLVPSYKLHKPSGQARVILDGKHFYLGPFGSEESREKYARLIARRSIQPAAIPCDPIDRQIENVSVSELIAGVSSSQSFPSRLHFDIDRGEKPRRV
jgi:hypothetical protein